MSSLFKSSSGNLITEDYYVASMSITDAYAFWSNLAGGVLVILDGEDRFFLEEEFSGIVYIF
jgi:hypothetical protein